MAYYQWAPYKSVATRRASAKKSMEKLKKKGLDVQPIAIEGRTISRSFWGQAWCEHLEQFSDYENRLPRGRTYVRNGSVCHLLVKKGLIEAIVSGSELYDVKINVAPLTARKWSAIKKQCANEIGSMLELLQGKFSDNVMKAVTDPKIGLFPLTKDIELHCSCPDGAYLCKHVAAVLYGVGARLDQEPEMLFILRDVDYEELISTDLHIAAQPSSRRRVGGDLSAIFGIDIEEAPPKRKAAKKAIAKPKIKKPEKTAPKK